MSTEPNYKLEISDFKGQKKATNDASANADATDRINGSCLSETGLYLFIHGPSQTNLLFPRNLLRFFI